MLSDGRWQQSGERHTTRGEEAWCQDTPSRSTSQDCPENMLFRLAGLSEPRPGAALSAVGLGKAAGGLGPASLDATSTASAPSPGCSEGGASRDKGRWAWCRLCRRWWSWRQPCTQVGGGGLLMARLGPWSSARIPDGRGGGKRGEQEVPGSSSGALTAPCLGS